MEDTDETNLGNIGHSGSCRNLEMPVVITGNERYQHWMFGCGNQEKREIV